ncbi:MAG TPA: TonB-dependent receptor [Xanthobacteraceae bacterium]|nr:TonB-dependent receptor [Xanthobacteraceae bacterium]
MLTVAAIAARPALAQQSVTLPTIEVISSTPIPARTTRPRRDATTSAPAPRRRPATTTAALPRQPAPAPAPAPARPDPAAIDRDKVPSNTQVLTPSDFELQKSTNLLDSLARGVPGAALSDQSGNAFQRNFDYRGFTASPVPGTPQGLAVYQNGVRINESYGDVVNWDLIPQMAINRLALVPSSPIFGLNAIGGALSFDMKNGFTYHGTDAEGLIGSFGRRQGSGQAGMQQDNLAAYATFDVIHDDGWRDFSSSSDVRRMYVDLGARNSVSEFHVNFTGADNDLGATVATPIEMLNHRWSSVYTWPQTTHLRLAFLTSSLSYEPTDTLSIQGNAYYRGLRQSHFDGNGTNGQPCDPGGALPGQLCIGDGNTPINQSMATPNTLPPSAFLGEIDRNQTATNSFGGSAQIASRDKLFGHENHFVVGTSLDHGHTSFTGNSELGTIGQNLFITGTGIFVNQPAADLTPVDLLATNTYLGLYATDTFDVTRRLSVTAGGRFNFAQVNLQDQTGTNPLLNSSNQFQRFNPVIGATYKLTPNLTGYAGYSEANRAPTPLELGCSDPVHPCMIDNFLISDPALKQVVSHTAEAGLRGTYGGDKDRLTWALGVFRTQNSDDILNVASAAVPMFGYFQNAGTTLRQGIEAKVDYRHDRWNVYANYTYVDATYRSSLILSSPNNPAADVNGNIFVHPGDVIPGIPAHRFKAGAEYAVTDQWKVGADLNVVGSQYLLHDDADQNPKVPPYWVVNLHGSYQVDKNVELFGLINNLFNQHYYSVGTFFSTAGFNSNTFGNPNFFVLNNPRTFVPGMPLAAYAGVRVKF